MLAAVVAILAVLLLVSAWWIRHLKYEVEVWRISLDLAAEDQDAMRAAAENAVVPMLWALDLQATYDHPENAQPLQRATLYASQAIVCLQDLLVADDAEMGEIVAKARLSTPPRRLPTRPQTPVYLATPETLAGVPLTASRGTPGTAFDRDLPAAEVDASPFPFATMRDLAEMANEGVDGALAEWDRRKAILQARDDEIPSLPEDAAEVNADIAAAERAASDALRARQTERDVATGDAALDRAVEQTFPDARP